MRVRALFGLALLLAACVDDKPTPLRNVPDRPPLEDVQVSFSGIDESAHGLDEKANHASLPDLGAHGCLAFDELVITRK